MGVRLASESVFDMTRCTQLRPDGWRRHAENVLDLCLAFGPASRLLRGLTGPQDSCPPRVELLSDERKAPVRKPPRRLVAARLPLRDGFLRHSIP